MTQHRRAGNRWGRPRIAAHERLERLIEARRAYLSGDVERALGAYSELLQPTAPHPSALLDLQRILSLFEQMAAADSEFQQARGRIRQRLEDLLARCRPSGS